jgi:hypothetical protein
VEFFSLVGYVCPDYANPPEFILTALSERRQKALSEEASHDLALRVEEGGVGGETHQEMIDKCSSLREFMLDNDASNRNSNSKRASAAKSAYFHRVSVEKQEGSSFLRQFTGLFGRDAKGVTRNLRLNGMRLAQSLFLSIFVSLLYWGLDKNQAGINGRVGVLFFLMSTQALIAIVSAVLAFNHDRALFLQELGNGR